MNIGIGEAELDALLRRHEAFWTMEDVAEPLLWTYDYRWLEDVEIRLPLADGTMAGEAELLTPDKINPRLFLGEESLLSWTRGVVPSSLKGDFFAPRQPFDLCWTEAIMGCKVYFSSRARWSEDYLEDWQDLDGIRLRADNRWLAKLLEFVEMLQEASQGRYFVTEPLLRGPIDMARALVGDTALCLAVHDGPAQLHRLLEICTDATIETFERIRERIPPFRGGWCTHFGIWAPGAVGYTQIDASVLFSADDFRVHFLPHYRRLVGSCDYAVIHVHSISSHHVEALMSLDDLAMIQITIDPPPFGPPVRELIPVFQKVQEAKPLLIEGPVSEDEKNQIVDTLSPQGLALGLGLQ